MKKILYVLLCGVLLLAFSACTENNDNEPPQNKKSGTYNEDFSGEHYKDFPDVTNIINYLKLDPAKEVLILSEEEGQTLTFCFYVEDEDKSSSPTYKHYIKAMEKSGYRLTVLDATISQTLTLEDKQHLIEMTVVSDMDSYKEVHKELKNADKIKKENLIFSITKK